jgi:outer membrane protein assembly factor BamD (BamD/ComL family)
VATVFSADFEKSNLRAQLYLGVTPYYPVDFVATGASNLVDKTVVPFQAGFLFSPFYTPAFKLDVPFTIWLGFEAGNWGWADLYDKGNIDSPANNTEKLAWSQWMPSVTGGVSVNLVGDIDLRLLGGVGMTRTTFGHTIIAGHTDNLSYTSLGYFGSVNLEFVLINEMMKNTDLKMAAFVRQDAHNIHNLVATLYDTSLSTGASVRLSNVKFQTIEQTRLKIGVEFSMDFGRESRSDRKKRFKLRDRTNELRKHNTAMDTLTEWDCMAIERDYKFFIASNGDLPNMSEQYTKSQFTDVLESFLAFCQPEDLKTREALYVTLDSNKVQLKTYQMTQEDTRYKQVMASNDVTYLKMFLQYYPKSRYRPGVESKIAVLDDYSAFRTARSGNSYKDYLQYLSNFPEGHYRKEAETGIFALVQAANRQKDYEIYMKKFPTGAYINEARKALHELIKATETGGSRF